MKQGIKEKDIKDFEKYAKKLSDVMARIREYKTEANAYLACSDLCLMSDDHQKNRDRAEQQKIIVTAIPMIGFDGGDY